MNTYITNTLNKSFLAFLLLLSSIGISLSSTVFAHGDEEHHAESEQTEFGQAGKATDVTRTIEISMGDNMRFSPDALTVKQGETIRLRLVNKGGSAHEFVLGTADEIAEHAELMKKFPMMEHSDPSSARAEAGKQKEIIWDFNKDGHFVFACLIPGHSEAGMRGTVTVTANGEQTAIKTETLVKPTSTETAATSSDLSEGEILNIDVAQAKLTIKHGALKNLGMPGMTMIFRVKDSAWLNQYKAGDKIQFRAEKVNGALTVTRIENTQ